MEKSDSIYAAATGVQSASPLQHAAACRPQILSLPNSLQITPSRSPYAEFRSCKPLRFQLAISMQVLILPFSFIFSSTCATCSAHLTPRPHSFFTLTICHTGLLQPVLTIPLLMPFWHRIFAVKFSIFLIACCVCL